MANDTLCSLYCLYPIGIKYSNVLFIVQYIVTFLEQNVDILLLTWMSLNSLIQSSVYKLLQENEKRTKSNVSLINVDDVFCCLYDKAMWIWCALAKYNQKVTLLIMIMQWLAHT